jgi:hypothetical protein
MGGCDPPHSSYFLPTLPDDGAFHAGHVRNVPRGDIGHGRMKEAAN